MYHHIPISCLFEMQNTFKHICAEDKLKFIFDVCVCVRVAPVDRFSFFVSRCCCILGQRFSVHIATFKNYCRPFVFPLSTTCAHDSRNQHTHRDSEFLAEFQSFFHFNLSVRSPITVHIQCAHITSFCSDFVLLVFFLFFFFS